MNNMRRINFNQEYYGRNAEAYVLRALAGEIFLEPVEKYLENLFENKKIFLTTSATTALELAFMASGIAEDGEVLLPSFTFPSIANIALRSGLTLSFCDIDKDMLTIDLDDVERKISKKTRILALPHYGGMSADMDRVTALCKAHNLILIEDAATAFDGCYKNKKLGTFGDFGVFSFHATKNVSSEQGGVLLIDEDSSFLEALDVAYWDGTNRSSFLSGKVPFYEWTAFGTNVRMTNLNAALLLAGLEEKEKIQDNRKKLWGIYKKECDKLAAKFPIDVMSVPMDREDNAHIFYVLFENEAVREQVRHRLLKKNIIANFHYMPLHQSPMGKKFCDKILPVTKHVARTLLRLPLHMHLSEEDVYFVINMLTEILESIYE